MRRFFLITQFASSMALLVVAGTFVRTIVATHLGEQSAAIGSHRGRRRGNRPVEWTGAGGALALVREALQRLPNVTAVTITSARLTERAALVPEGSAPSASRAAIEIQRIDDGFYRSIGDRIAAGRFDADATRAGWRRAHRRQRARRTTVLGHDCGDRSPILARHGPGHVQVAAVVRDDNAGARIYRALRDDDVISREACSSVARSLRSG